MKYHLDLLRPQETHEVNIGFVVSDKPGRYLINLYVRADNLAQPLEKRITVDFNAPVLDKWTEADFYKTVFDTWE